MRPPDRIPRGGGPGPDWREPRGEAIGPQGAALILELQRLRGAFEQERAQELSASQPRPAPRRGARPAATRHPHPPRSRPRKGRVARVLDACLLHFGLIEPDQAWDDANNVGRRDRVPSPLPPEIVVPDPVTMARPRRAREPEPPQGWTREGEVKLLERLRSQRMRPQSDERAADAPPVTLSEAVRAAEEASAAVGRSLPLDPPQVAPPVREIQTGSAVGRLIEIGRSSVMSGVAFLIEPNGLPDNDNVSGESLVAGAGRSFERELRTGLRVLLVALVLGGGWLALMPLAAAVVVPGSLAVQSSVKTIQHPTGGIVAEIPVHNGMRVSAGDLLMRLDPTQAQASLQVVNKQLDELRARTPRLTAERDGLDTFEFSAELTARANEPAVGRLLASEQSLFKARSSARKGQKDLLQSRVAQLGEEIAGLEAQVDSKAKQIELISGELTGVQDLYDKRLVPLTRLTTLQREAARIEGERGQLVSAIAETKGKIGEAQLQMLRVDQDFRTDVVKELGETRAKEAELTERSVAARDMLNRIELRAPTAGVIHQLAVHTIGGVIRAGDTVMEVVPDSDDLLIEARLQPNDIDQVKTGQDAFVRFSAFNQRVTPQLSGTVSYVAADTSKDQQSNAPFYAVRVTLPEDERHRMAGLQLVSGMPAEVFLQTGSRTMLSYLLKPITDQLRRAFVER